MSLNTFTYLRAHSLPALFYLDKKKKRRRRAEAGGINREEELEGGWAQGWEISGRHGDAPNQKIWSNLAKAEM